MIPFSTEVEIPVIAVYKRDGKYITVWMGEMYEKENTQVI